MDKLILRYERKPVLSPAKGVQTHTRTDSQGRRKRGRKCPEPETTCIRNVVKYHHVAHVYYNNSFHFQSSSKAPPTPKAVDAVRRLLLDAADVVIDSHFSGVFSLYVL